MKTKKIIENLVLELNRKISDFSFNFFDEIDYFSLKLEKDYLIKFSKDTGGNQLISNNEWLALKHSNHSLHEPGLIGIILLLKEKEIKLEKLLEVGSHYGYFSSIIPSIFAKIIVKGIEINNNSIEVAKKNILINGLQLRVNFELAAISNKNSKDNFIINGFDLIEFNIFKYLKILIKNILFFNFSKKTTLLPNVHRINSYTLDEYCSRRNFFPDIIKIDVEGFQSYIIPYALKYIEKYKPIIILEFDDIITMQKFGKMNYELASVIIDKGYELIWGNHRIKEGSFIHIDKNNLKSIDITENSLGLFIPNETVNNFI